MAKSDLTVNIGSKFNGEGFKKLNQSVKTASKDIGKVGLTVSKLTQEMGTMGGVAGKTAGAVSGVVGSFMLMGIVGAVIAGGTLAIEGLFTMLNKANESAKKLSETLQNNFKNALAKVAETIKHTKSEFDTLADDKKFGSQILDSKTAGKVERMELDKRQALIGKSGEEAAKIELEWRKKINSEISKGALRHLEEVREQIRLKKEEKKLNEDSAKEAERKMKFFMKISNDEFNAGNTAQANIAHNEWLTEQATANKHNKRAEELDKEIEKLKLEELKADEARLTAYKKELIENLESGLKIRDELKKVEAEILKEKQEREAKRLAELDKQQKELLAAQKAAMKEMNAKHKEKLEAIRDKDKQTIEQIDADLKKLDEAIKSALEVLDKNKPNFAQSLNQQNRDRKQQDRDEKRLANIEANNKKQAQNMVKSLSGRVFDRDGNIRKSANANDVSKLINGVAYTGDFGSLSKSQQKTLTNMRSQLEALDAKGQLNDKGKSRLADLRKMIDSDEAGKKLKLSKKERKELEAKRALAEKNQAVNILKIKDFVEKIKDNMGV